MAGNLFLIGLMGAGKTTLGRQLADHLQYPFYDSDNVICQRTGVNIPTIFEIEGEQGFRQRESMVIQELTAMDNIVLATGGGAVLREENRHCLRNRGTVIYLHVLPEILFERTKYDKNRPLLQVADPLSKFRELYETRHELYCQTAHMILEVGKSGCQTTLNRIFELVGRK